MKFSVMVIIMYVPPGEGLPCVLMGLSPTTFVTEDKRKAGRPPSLISRGTITSEPGKGPFEALWNIDAHTEVLFLLSS